MLQCGVLKEGFTDENHIETSIWKTLTFIFIVPQIDRDFNLKNVKRCIKQEFDGESHAGTHRNIPIYVTHVHGSMTWEEIQSTATLKYEAQE